MKNKNSREQDGCAICKMKDSEIRRLTIRINKYEKNKKLRRRNHLKDTDI